MNAELRERLGKAAYTGRVRFYHEIVGMEKFDEPPLAQQGEDIRELYRLMGEAAVLSFVELFLPVIRNMLSEDEIKRLLSSLK